MTLTPYNRPQAYLRAREALEKLAETGSGADSDKEAVHEFNIPGDTLLERIFGLALAGAVEFAAYKAFGGFGLDFLADKYSGWAQFGRGAVGILATAAGVLLAVPSLWPRPLNNVLDKELTPRAEYVLRYETLIKNPSQDDIELGTPVIPVDSVSRLHNEYLTGQRDEDCFFANGIKVEEEGTGSRRQDGGNLEERVFVLDMNGHKLRASLRNGLNAEELANSAGKGTVHYIIFQVTGHKQTTGGSAVTLNVEKVGNALA